MAQMEWMCRLSNEFGMKKRRKKRKKANGITVKNEGSFFTFYPEKFGLPSKTIAFQQKNPKYF